MKRFTQIEKKWALTGCLVLLLGFSVSIHQKSNSIGLANLASEIPSQEVLTTKGKVNVKYVQNGDNTIAIVNKYDAQGKICTTCGTKTITLSTAFKSDDMTELNIALLKYIAAEGDGTAKPEKVVKAKGVVTPDEAVTDKALTDDEKADKAFAAIETFCEQKDGGQEQLTCYGENFKNVLKGQPGSEVLKLLKPDHIVGKDLKKIAAAKAAKFYKEHIAKLITTQVKESTRIATLQRRAQLGDASAREELSTLDTNDYQEIRTSALDTVKDLMGDLPKEYKNIRILLTSSEKNLMFDGASDFQSSLREALTTKDPVKFAQLKIDNDTKKDSVENLMNAVLEVNRSGLSDAKRAKLIGGDDVTTYSNFVNSYAKLITDGMMLNPKDYTIPTPDGSLNLAALGRIALNGKSGNELLNSSANLTELLQTSPGITGSASSKMTADDLAKINANRAALGMPPVR